MKRWVGILFFMLAFAIQGWNAQLLIVADEWPQMEVLSKFLEQSDDYQIQKVEQKDFPANLAGYEAVFEFVHGNLSEDVAQKLISYTHNGGRLIVMHHGISSGKRKTPGWYEFLGIDLPVNQPNPKDNYSYIHDMKYTFVNLQPHHYITSNKITWPEAVEYKSSDAPSHTATYPAKENADSEIFLNHTFTDGREKTVLFGFLFKHPETGDLYMQDRGGWYKRAEKGWVFYFMPGHSALEMDSIYCQIILNALTWKPQDR